MDKIIDSIKKRPLNIVLMIVVSVLYILNNKMIKPLTTGSIHIFLFRTLMIYCVRFGFWGM